MHELVQTATCSTEFVDLKRAGVIVDYPETKLENLSDTSPLVSYQDGIWKTLWRMTFNILRTRSSTLIRHGDGLPASLAGMLHDNEELVMEKVREFRSAVEAFEEAATKVHISSSVKSMVHESPLNITGMQWCIRFCRAGQWGPPTPQLRRLLHVYFRSFGQTKIVEDALGSLRDVESRAGPAKEVHHFTCWQKLVDSKLMAKYDRPEITHNTSVPVPKEFNGDSLFHVVAKSDGSTDSVDLRMILDRRDWTSWNAQSVKTHISHMMLLRQLHETGEWRKADTAWHAQLLPEGVIIKNKKSGLLYMNLKVLDVASLAWPVQETEPDVYELDLGVSRLSWCFAFSLDDYDVVPTIVLSPLHMLLTGMTVDKTFQFQTQGAKMSLEEYHIEHGFVGISEGVMKKLCKDMELDVQPEADLTEVPFADVLALQLAQNRRTMTEDEARAFLFRRSHDGDDICKGYLDEITEEEVQDVVLIGDIWATKQFIKDRDKAKVRRAAAQDTVSKIMNVAYPRVVSTVNKRAQTKAAAKKAEAALLKRRQAAFAACAEDSEKFVESRRPQVNGCKVYVDNLNGRYRLSYTGFSEKSVAWTQRGQHAAAMVAFGFLWTCHKKRTGQDAPDDLDLSWYI